MGVKASLNIYSMVAAAGLLLALAVPTAHANDAAAQACAAKLPKDAQTIFSASLPDVHPGVDLREVLTSHTRSLAIAGTIDRGNARSNAREAATCLRLAGG